MIARLFHFINRHSPPSRQEVAQAISAMIADVERKVRADVEALQRNQDDELDARDRQIATLRRALIHAANKSDAQIGNCVRYQLRADLFTENKYVSQQ